MTPGQRDRIVVLLNARAGTLAKNQGLSDQVAEAFAAAGLTPDIRQVPGADLVTTARAMIGTADVVVVGGGDGSVSAVAGALAGTDVKLGVLPLGTLNHFAKDAGIPLEVADAVRTIAGGHERRVDVAEVDGRVFINNSSLGIYPSIVLRREQIQRRRGLPKWLAFALGMVAALRRLPLFRVQITTDQRRWMTTSPMVFVGCNRYAMSLFDLGERKCLDGGELCLHIARCTSRLGVVALVCRALLGRLGQARDFESVYARQVTIETRRRHLLIAADGEVVPARGRLRYRVQPGALRLLVPPPAASVQESAA